MTSKKKTPSFTTHINAMSTRALVWEVLQIAVSWVGLIWAVSTGRTSLAVLFGVYYLGNAIATVGREIAYRDDRRSRQIYGDIHITGGQRFTGGQR